MGSYKWTLIIDMGRKGGPGSGHHGHAGRPGQVGGSAPGGGAIYGIGKAPPDPTNFSAPEVDNTALAFEGYVAGLPERNYLDASDQIRGEVKKEIIAELSERTGIPRDDVNAVIAQWAQTSNDGDMRSLSLQRDAAEEFGLSLSNFTKSKIADVEHEIDKRLERMFENYTGSMSQEERRAWIVKTSARGEWQGLLPAEQQRNLLRAMYGNTQQWLKDAGISGHIVLNRGVKLPYEQTKDLKVGDVIDVTGNALESWSMHKPTANNFARLRHTGERGQIRGLTLRMSVPVEAIISSARTGFGCLTEGEFVVLGIPGKAEIVEISG